jgi:hypothetical protein
MENRCIVSTSLNDGERERETLSVKCVSSRVDERFCSTVFTRQHTDTATCRLVVYIEFITHTAHRASPENIQIL